MNKFAAVIIAAAAIAASTNNLAEEKDILDYFDPLRSFEVVLITPTLEADSKTATADADGGSMVKRKSLAGSNKHTLAAATGNSTKPIQY